MKKKMIIALVCVLLLVVATFVACDDTPNTPTPQGEQLVDAYGVVKKPVAEPDPNNELDQKYYHVCTIEDNFVDNQVCLSLTNAESLNNLYYTYSPQDFPGLGVIDVRYDGDDSYIKRFREEYENGVAYTPAGMLHPSRFSRFLALTLDQRSKENVLRVCDALIKIDGVRAAEPNGIMEHFAMVSTSPTNDPQWGNTKIKLEGAWQFSIGSDSINVGVMDAGVALHPALLDNLSETRKIYGYQGLSADQSTEPADIRESMYLADSSIHHEPHGTMVAGVIGSKKTNSDGVAGVCQNVTMISLNVMGEDGEEDIASAILATQEANSLGIKVINYSAGGVLYNSQFETAIKNFDGIFVCGAGNVGQGGITQALIDDTHKVYPACYNSSNIIAVGATDRDDNIAEISCYGSDIDLFAPGVGIRTTAIAGGFSGMEPIYIEADGTSMAAPYVAGVAALLFSRCPTLTSADVQSSILTNLDKVSGLYGKCGSNGRLNAEEALKNFIHPSCAHRRNLGITVGHAYACDYCDYHADLEPHRWIPHKIGGVANGYDCAVCGAYTKNIEIIHPYLAPDIQNQITALTLSGTTHATIEIDEHTAIVYDNGRLYLMVECDEYGNIVSAVPDEIFAPGYSLDRIIAEQQVA